MTAADLIRDLQERGVVLELLEGQVRCRGRRSVLTANLLDQIRAHREELRGLLEGSAPADPVLVPDRSAAAPKPMPEPRPTPKSRDALYGCGLVLELMKDYKSLFGAPDGFITLLERVSSCDTLHGHVTDEDLLKLRAHLDALRAGRGEQS